MITLSVRDMFKRETAGSSKTSIESSWNVMAHGDALEGKWRGNWQMEWVASTIHTTSEHGVSSITTVDAHILAASSRLNWTDAPANLNGLVRFVERRNLVSACVPSHFKRSLPTYWTTWHHIWEGLISMSLLFFYSQTHGLTVHEKAMHQSFKMFTA